MNKILRVSILLPLLLIACNKERGELASQRSCIPRKQLQGIVGGSVVRSSDSLANRVVMLSYKTKKGDPFICTGTPIASDVILTAAHCVDDISTLNVVFAPDLLCETGFDVNKQTIRGVQVAIPPQYRPDIRAAYDVALVRLASPIPSHYVISSLYNGSNRLSSNKVTFAGYGRTASMRRDEMFLRKVQKRYNQLSWEGRNLEVDQTDVKGICKGDSGGPVFFEVDGLLQIAGVNSIVRGSAEDNMCETTSISMYIPAHREWIDRVLLLWKGRR